MISFETYTGISQASFDLLQTRNVAIAGSDPITFEMVTSSAAIGVIGASPIEIELAQVHMGLSGAGVGLLRESMRLAEFSTPEAKSQARTNLELETIDCGTFN